MLQSQPTEGERVEIPIPLREPFIVYVHPDGALTFLEAQIRSKLDDVARAEKRLGKINRALTSGLLDADEYKVAKAAADKNHTEALAEIQKQCDAGEITTLEKDNQEMQLQAAYRETCSDLLNQRDGEPLTAEEDEKLSAEKSHWERRANFKPFAVPYLMNVLLDWEYYKDAEAKERGEKFPISESLLQSMGDLQIKLVTIGVMNHYQKKVAEEKKSSQTGSDSTMTNGQAEALPTGDSSIKSVENGEEIQTKLPDGEAESCAAVQ